ncbi:MAG TPA: hypothetical protein VF574_08655 [Allosphingosinicella sp.]|jgi:hypothetical protein
MNWPVLLLAALGAAALLMLLLKLRGGGRRDLLGPPKRKPRKLSRAEIERLAGLVGRGDEVGALRELEGAGYDGASARRMVGLMARLAGTGAEADDD